MALQQLPAPAAKALVKIATVASPKGTVQPLATLDFSALIEAQAGAPTTASLELARWFMVVGRADLAGNLIATAAQGPDELTQIRAAELGADLLVSQRRYNYAVQGYEYAQTLIGRLHVDAKGYPRTIDWRGDDTMLAERISDKLATVRGLIDRELYGPGYVAYREAERLRRTADDPVAALVKHERLRIEQPGVIFASAARGAMVKCLLQLALLPARGRPRSPYRDAIELRLRNLKATFASLTLV